MSSRINILLSHLLSDSTLLASNVNHFDSVPTAPQDAVFGLKAKYMADSDNRKVDLGIGAYRTNEGKPYVLKVVKKVEKEIINDGTLNKEYSPIEGEALFRNASKNLMFGATSNVVKEKRVATVQCLSGTGSLRVGAEFVAEFLKNSAVLISKPTWGNHNAIFTKANIKQLVYRYWDDKKLGLNLSGMLDDLRNAPNRSIILLHVCAHNPTGVDPTLDEWKQIAQVMTEKNHFPFFDCAYQGFASGDLSRDSAPVRLFVDLGFEMIVCQSFAKNFGLYSERIGALHVVASSAKVAEAVTSQLAVLIRPMYSNPPRHGAHIVGRILSNPTLFAEWEAELKGMAERIKSMRTVLLNELIALKTPGNWNHIVTQIGMFSYTGLTPKQVEKMLKVHHVYLLSNGRVSMAGVNTNNVAYIAKAIDDVVRTVQN